MMIDTKTVSSTTLTKTSTPQTIDTEASLSTQEFEGVSVKLGFDTKVKNPVKLIPFTLMHIACLGVLLVDFSVSALLLCIGLYAIRMFALTAGYHRYFSHRSYKTS